MLYLIGLLFLGLTTGQTNIALRKSATQSTTQPTFTPDRAVDGGASSRCSLQQGSVSCTLSEDKPWWMVDFGDLYDVEKVKVVSRDDSSKRTIWVGKFNIFIGNSSKLNSLEQCAKNIDVLKNGKQVVLGCLGVGTHIAIKRVRNPNNFPLCLCEVEVNGTRACPSGNFGDHCQNKCSGCLNGLCHGITGECVLGCVPGFSGTSCETPCSNGYYGKGCLFICSSHCTDTCNSTDGACKCKRGYKGPTCRTPCDVGTFGDDCSNLCPRNCWNDCDPKYGKCNKCTPGYQGEYCQLPCRIGFYGQDCMQKCPGECPTSCHHVTAKCFDVETVAPVSSKTMDQTGDAVMETTVSLSVTPSFKGPVLNRTNVSLTKTTQMDELTTQTTQDETSAGGTFLDTTTVMNKFTRKYGNSPSVMDNSLSNQNTTVAGTSTLDSTKKGIGVTTHTTQDRTLAGGTFVDTTTVINNFTRKYGNSPSVMDNVDSNESPTVARTSALDTTKRIVGVGLNITTSRSVTNVTSKTKEVTTSLPKSTKAKTTQTLTTGRYNNIPIFTRSEVSRNPVTTMRRQVTTTPPGRHQTTHKADGGFLSVTKGASVKGLKATTVTAKDMYADRSGATISLLTNRGGHAVATKGSSMNTLKISTPVTSSTGSYKTKEAAYDDQKYYFSKGLSNEGLNITVTMVYVHNLTVEEDGALKYPRHTSSHVNSTIAYTGIALILILLLLLMVLLFVFWRFRGAREKQTDAEMKVPEETGRTPHWTNNVSETSLQKIPLNGMTRHKESSSMNTYNKYNTNGKQLSFASLPVTGLPEYIRAKTSTDRYKQEFDSMPWGQQAPWDSAMRPHVYLKNRYHEYLAYDHSRVTLSVIDDDPTTDYINASYIDGFRTPRRYIAAQGPSKGTVADFVRMLWEQNIPVVVMLTNSVESGNVMSEIYLPDTEVETSVLYGDDLILQVEAEKRRTKYTVRTLQILKDGQGKTLKHFHYKAWPEKNLPADSSTLLAFMDEIMETTDRDDIPILVHCNTGVGRTGTFIALDYLLEQVREEEKVNVPAAVFGLRRDRVNMVDTLELYAFIYETLAEVLFCEPTSIHISTFSHFPELFDDTRHSDEPHLPTEQFKILQAITPSVSYPSESAFNVTAFDASGLDLRLKLYALKSRSAESVGDFWELVHKRKVTAILSLDTELQSYHPTETGNKLECGNFFISQTSEFKSDLYTERTFAYTYKDSESRIVKYYNVDAWGEESDVHVNQDGLLELLGLMSSWQESRKNSILIHCPDGATCTGVVCALIAICQSIDKKQVVDVYHVVKALKRANPEFIGTLSQYQSLYNFAKVYVEEKERENDRRSSIAMHGIW